MSSINKREKLESRLSSNQNLIRLTSFIEECIEFMTFFEDLQFGRNFVLSVDYKMIDSSLVLGSAIRTLNSIYYCCKIGNLSDASILTRRYREDLFFYLFIVVARKYESSEDYIDRSLVLKEDKIIDDWLSGSLKNVKFTDDILKYLGTHKILSETVRRFEFQTGLHKIGTKLNKYVHWNGLLFYNRSYNLSSESDSKLIDDVIFDIDYINITFVTLLSIAHPISIMASDYLDYLDCGVIPPEGSQYLVAPSICDFIKSKAFYFSDDFIDYLEMSIGMKLK